jgi:hypothetical protein
MAQHGGREASAGNYAAAKFSQPVASISFPRPRVICMPDYLQAGEELTHAKFAAGLCRMPAYAARRAV